MSKTNESFISVEGDDLQARLEAAQTQAQSASRYWTAYKFPVRPSVSIDAVSINSMGIETQVGIITGNVGEHETRSLGVFLLYEERELLRVEIYNLERERNYEGWPVYWLGEVEAPESLTLLNTLLRATTNETIGGKLTDAIALHDSPQVEGILSELARSSTLVAVRAGAVFCLGRFGQNLALVEEVAGNRLEHTFVRQQAIMAIGKSRTQGALDALRRLLAVVEEYSLRETIVNAVAKSQHPDAKEVLKTFAERGDDPGLSQRAQMQLLKASGEKSRMKEAKGKEYARRVETKQMKHCC
jgi:HEAT repeat protein